MTTINLKDFYYWYIQDQFAVWKMKYQDLRRCRVIAGWEEAAQHSKILLIS